MSGTMSKETPLMKQYFSIKEKHPESILFFRLGDFYEMFCEDALKASKLLDLTLTSRDKKSATPISMCGVPHHSAQKYISKLISLGEKVVLCEQTEDAKQVKGIVKREVVQIITPGIYLDEDGLEPKTPCYVAAISVDHKQVCFGISYADVSTGEFYGLQIDGVEKFLSELARIDPRELLFSKTVPCTYIDLIEKTLPKTIHTEIQSHDEDSISFLNDKLTNDIETIGLTSLVADCCADVLRYAYRSQPVGIMPIQTLNLFQTEETMLVDESAVKHLEIVVSLSHGTKQNSLLSVIDQTKTAFGGRLLRQWLLYPQNNKKMITQRQDAIDYLIEHATLRNKLVSLLSDVADIQRLVGRASLLLASPWDLCRIRDSLFQFPRLIDAINATLKDKTSLPVLLDLDYDKISQGNIQQLMNELQKSLIDSFELRSKNEDFVREGYCSIMDTHVALSRNAKNAVLKIERQERDKTGINNLKIKYNRVFGYYIEVSKTQINKVPNHYVRKQTIASAERYITEELSKLEVKIISAQDIVSMREKEILEDISGQVTLFTQELCEIGSRLSVLDCILSLAEVAHFSGYVRPTIDHGLDINIVDGRHPVVEKKQGANTFVANHCKMNNEQRKLLLITGPNMAGKSTYMRQVAHIVLLAQMGSFVPAASAHIGLVDRLFTRVGASDNLAHGESTFMVEMNETSRILSQATSRSLVVLDEIGRGTSTFDGVSIAWAVTEYLHNVIQCRTLIATHYHELCSLADQCEKITNISVAAQEVDGELVLLHHIVEGGASRSYGIDVARLANLPIDVIDRAKEILVQLEQEEFQTEKVSQDNTTKKQTACDPNELMVLNDIRHADLNNMTPVDALILLTSLKKKI